MSYQSERDAVGRQSFTRVEIDMPTCANTYGVAPCTASAGIGNECRNTRNTCQDPDNYDGSTVNTLVLCDDNIAIPGVPMRPLILGGARGKRFSSTLIDKKKALGRRAEIKLTCRDEPSHDRDIDPYWATRPYVAEEQGSFWGKVKAIYKYYSGSPLRVITGYIGETYSAADSITRNYILEELTGPRSGNYTLVARDVLKLADDKRAVFPAYSTGVLQVAITDVSTASFTITGGAGEYPVGGGKLRIEDEVIQYTSGSDSFDDFVVAGTITRATDNTEASSHDAGSTVQLCAEVNGNVVDFVYELFTTYGNIPASYITIADWVAERDLWFSAATITQVVTKPEGVTSLIEELGKAYLFKTWWDDVNQKIRFRAVAPSNSVSTIWDDKVTALDSDISASEKLDERITRIHVYYNPRNPIEYDKPEHFRSVYSFVGADSESADFYGDTRSINIFARFISADGLAVRCGSRTYSIFRDPPKVIQLEVDAKDTDIVTGDGVNLSVFENQDVDGSAPTVLMQVMSMEEIDVGHRYRYRLEDTTFYGRYGRIMSSSASSTFSSATQQERDIGCYISGAGGVDFSINEPAYKIV